MIKSLLTSFKEIPRAPLQIPPRRDVISQARLFTASEVERARPGGGGGRGVVFGGEGGHLLCKYINQVDCHHQHQISECAGVCACVCVRERERHC